VREDEKPRFTARFSATSAVLRAPTIEKRRARGRGGHEEPCSRAQGQLRRRREGKRGRRRLSTLSTSDAFMAGKARCEEPKDEKDKW
jgi:hypothetical protein